VTIADALQREAYLASAPERSFKVTERGKLWFEQLGIAMPDSSETGTRKLAHQCPDWTERRPHLAGTLGVIFHKRLLEMGWISPIRSSRAIGVTLKGREALLKHLGIVVG
jgi:hypothetical protein